MPQSSWVQSGMILKGSCLHLNTETVIVFVSILKEFVESSVEMTVVYHICL